MTVERFHLDGDWFPGGVPANVRLGDAVYLDTSYSFDAFGSDAQEAFVAGTGTGVYDRAILVTTRDGRIGIGPYGCVNGTTIVASREVTIGANALMAWGAFVTDSGFGEGATVEARRAALLDALADEERPMPTTGVPEPVVLEDNVWIGFGAVVCPGVRIGSGSVVGARAVVREDVPPYSVVVGDPARVVATLAPPDDAAVREHAAAVRREGPPGRGRAGAAGGGTWLTGDIGNRTSPRDT